MIKRADIGITRVRYNENGLIDELEVRPFDGELLQRQIDGLVYELYELTEEEIGIVEEATQ